jgi:hypothetical protein
MAEEAFGSPWIIAVLGAGAVFGNFFFLCSYCGVFYYG